MLSLVSFIGWHNQYLRNYELQYIFIFHSFTDKRNKTKIEWLVKKPSAFKLECKIRCSTQNHRLNIFIHERFLWKKTSNHDQMLEGAKPYIPCIFRIKKMLIGNFENWFPPIWNIFKWFPCGQYLLLSFEFLFLRTLKLRRFVRAVHSWHWIFQIVKL